MLSAFSTPPPPVGTVPGKIAYRPKQDDAALKYVRELGLPAGIGDQIIASTRDFAMRYWLVDNGGSMATSDGHRVVRGAGGREGMVACSRWEELGEGIKYLARSVVARSTRNPTPPPGRA